MMLLTSALRLAGTLIASIWKKTAVPGLPLQIVLPPALSGPASTMFLPVPLFFRLREEVCRMERYGKFVLPGPSSIINGEQAAMAQEKLPARQGGLSENKTE